MKKFIKSILAKVTTDVGTKNEYMRDIWVKTSIINFPEGSRILDVGAGEQRYRSFCAHLEYLSQDFCEYSGQGDGTALQTGRWDTSRTDIVSDLACIPAPDASFDAILCMVVLEHVPDPVAALREF